MSGPGSEVVPSRMPRSHQVVLSVYLAGCAAWLVLGVLPTLAQLLPPLERAMQTAAAGGGPLAVYAERVLAGAMAPQPLGAWALAYLFSGLNLALGLLLIIKRPPGVVPMLLALAFIGTAATFNEPSHEVFHVLGEPWPVKAVHFMFHVVSGVAYLWAVVLFPDGRLPVRRSLTRLQTRLLAIGGTAAVAVVCWRSSFIAHPPFFVAFFGVLVPLAGVIAQSARLRIDDDATSSAQSRLLRVALLPGLAAAVVWLVGEGLATSAVELAVGHQISAAVQSLFPALFAVVPVVMFIAILRHRLWDIDVIASKVLLLAVLLTFIGVVYVGSLALTGWWLRGRGWVVLVPLIIVACVAEPVRAWGQRWCNRLVFGTRLSPREAVRALVDRFSGVGEVDELTELTHVVVDSTRASSAALWLVAEDGLLSLAAHPGPARTERLPVPEPTLAAYLSALAPAQCWPIRYEGELLGVVAVTTPPGVALASAELRLLDDLAHHAGLLVANARLTVDLAHELDVVAARAAELQVSRQQVVRAQDVQRHRLEADIHDGAQQLLVALLVELGVLQRAREAGPAAQPRLTRLRMLLHSTKETLAGLAAGGAPPVLVESGLSAALEDAADGARAAGLIVTVECDASGLVGSDAQTAVYFCCVEALQNVVKHAKAATARIEVTSDPEVVTFVVADDGAGFAVDSSPRGSGLGNLAERVAPHGGRVEIESRTGRGTTVRGTLPASTGSGSPAAPAEVGAR